MAQKKNSGKKSGKSAQRKKQQQTRRMMALTIIALIVIVGGFGIYYASSGGQTSQSQARGGAGTHINNKRTTASNGNSGSSGGGVQFDYKKQPELGNPNAPVKIVEFGDYRCSVCYHFDREFFPKIKKQFIQTGKASFYFMNYPILGQGSVRAALASESVFHREPKVFWKWHETVYAHQGPEQKQWATTDFLVSLAKKNIPQINPKQLRSDIENATYLNDVKSDAEKGKSLGIQGTPTIFINGKKMDWPHTSQYPKLKAAINAAYKEAAKNHG